MSSLPARNPTPDDAHARRRRFDYATFRRDAFTTNWSMTNARAGLLCMPVIVAWIYVGLISGHHEWAVRPVAGATAVAYGAFQRFGKRELWPLFVTLVGITIATWIGCVAGSLGAVAIVCVATLWGLGFGAMTSIGYSTWWIGLQWTIALLVYGAQAYPPGRALYVALGVFVGGASQLAVLAVLLPLAGGWFNRQAQPPFNDEDERLSRQFARNVNPRTLAGRYAIRVALALGLAAGVDRFWGIANGYWIPMTAAILLKPDLQETTLRGTNRLVGTLVSAGTTSLVLAWLRPDPHQLGLLLMLAIYTCFVLQRVHYALFAAAVTAYVVLLLSLVGLPSNLVVAHRLEATLTGAAIALVVHAVPIPMRRAIIAAPRRKGA